MAQAQVKTQIAFEKNTGSPLLKVCGDITRLSYRELRALASEIAKNISSDTHVSDASLCDAILGATDTLLDKHRE